MKGKKPGVLALQCFHSTETNPGQSENWVWHVDILLSSGGLLHWLWHVNKPEENVFVSFQWPTFWYLRISRKLPKPRADFRSPSFCAWELLCSASPKKKKKAAISPQDKEKNLVFNQPLVELRLQQSHTSQNYSVCNWHMNFASKSWAQWKFLQVVHLIYRGNLGEAEAKRTVVLCHSEESKVAVMVNERCLTQFV